jgi:hypothetical protein
LVDFSYNFIIIKYEDSCKFIKYNQKVYVNQVKLASKIGAHQLLLRTLLALALSLRFPSSSGRHRNFDLRKKNSPKLSFYTTSGNKR